MNGKKNSNRINLSSELNSVLRPELFEGKSEIGKVKLFEDVCFSGEQMFGKADAVYEAVEVLKGFAVERNDCEMFYDEDEPLVMLCAPKGMGKTTLCKLWENELSNNKGCITLMPTPDSPGFGEVSNLMELTALWKKKLLTLMLFKISNDKIHVAHQIIDSAEVAGDRLKKVPIFTFFQSAVLSYDSFHQTGYSEYLNALEDCKSKDIWLFLDEYDYDFDREIASVNKIAALLNAARDLTIKFANIKIRITIRPNVWATLRSSIALMSNFRESVLNLDWSPREIRSILARRIEQYIQNFTSFGKINWDWVKIHNKEKINQEDKENWLIAQVFDTYKFDLGKGNRAPEVVLAKLCADRPRWIIELCKTASEIKDSRPGVILIDDITASFDEIGGTRFTDIVSEYRHYCPQLDMIINVFYNAKSSYILSDLVRFVDEKITSKTDIEIVGLSAKCTAKQVINFLFELTFVEPKQEKPDKKGHEFLHYADYPNLIETEIHGETIGEALFWYIHPAFRNYLNIGIPSNKKRKKNERFDR
jgi:hypothetical protein